MQTGSWGAGEPKLKAQLLASLAADLGQVTRPSGHASTCARCRQQPCVPRMDELLHVQLLGQGQTQ